MRALVFFLSLVLAFLILLKFYSDPAGEEFLEEDLVEATEGSPGRPRVRFLDPPGGGEVAEGFKGEALANRSPALDEVGSAGAGALEREAAPDAEQDLPEWLKGIELAPVRDDNELFLAAIVVHGTPEQVALRAAAGPLERGLVAEAFSRAVAGDPRTALAKASELPEGAITVREQGLLQAALEGKPNTIRPLSAASEGPLILAMEMGLLSRRADGFLENRAYRQAAQAFSDLLLAELNAPWAADHSTLVRFSEGLDRAQNHHRWNRKGEWSAVEIQVEDGDSLVAIRKRYVANYPDAPLCTGLIQAANQLPEHAVIHRGQTLRIPTDPVRAQVDLSARWCLLLLGDEVCGSWPVGIGRPGEETPPGEYEISDKIENPPWARIGQEIIPYGDLRNPLGTRWMGWSREGIKTSLGFHGTREPESVGLASSDGCVRFVQSDIERLFELLPIGGKVLVRE